MSNPIIVIFFSCFQSKLPNLRLEECLRLEVPYLIVARNTELQSGSLARPESDFLWVQLWVLSHQVPGLESRERHTDLEVNYLSGINGNALVQVRLLWERVEGERDILLCYWGELGSIDLLELLLHQVLFADLYHFETNVLAFLRESNP